MTDYIDKTALKMQIYELLALDSKESQRKWNHILALIEAAPAVDVRSNEHSHWYRDKGTNQCLSCSKYSMMATPYCPFCGAQMEKEGSKWN